MFAKIPEEEVIEKAVLEFVSGATEYNSTARERRVSAENLDWAEISRWAPGCWELESEMKQLQETASRRNLSLSLKILEDPQFCRPL